MIWTVSCVPTLEYFILERGYRFDTNLNVCYLPAHADSSHLWSTLDKINFLGFSAVPVAVTIVCNIGLVYIVFKSTGHASRAATRIIVSLTVLLIPSWTPATVYVVTQKTTNYVYFRTGYYMIPVDSTLSPVMYYWLNAGFREYVREIFSIRKNRVDTAERASSQNVPRTTSL